MLLEARRLWTLTKLGHLVNAGRRDGWLPGDVIDGVAALENIALPAEVSPMSILAKRLELSGPEEDTLWILACIELFPDVAAASQVLVGYGMHELNAQVIEQLTSIDEAGVARLASLGLVEANADRRLPLFRRSVRASDRVLELARGRFGLDPAMRAFATLEVGTHAIAQSQESLVVAVGVEGSGREAAMRRLVAGHSVLTVDCTRLSTDAGGVAEQMRGVAREAALHGAVLLLRDLDAIASFDVAERELRAVRGCVLATARATGAWPTKRPLVVIDVELPDEAGRAALWHHALPEARDAVIAECARRYTIAPAVIASVANAARLQTTTVEVEHVHLALRAQLERKLSGLATRIETKQTWDDLVLPVDQQDVLFELIARVRHRGLVMDTWGFADKVGRGLGMSVLLSGPPGTGKTMIAGLLAKELGLDLYQVDLSKIVSKYIGETEKQLAALFEAAEAGHAVLLFDEADSLFGKRTEVKSSNDRYANLEVNYLLQRMEQFTGISLLTTNHEKAIDPAFQRRLAFHLRVPMPDEEQRQRMWTSMIPARAARVANLNVGALARGFVMSGGYIKNAVVRAAFLAASEGAAIATSHLQRAARLEYEAMGKIAS